MNYIYHSDLHELLQWIILYSIYCELHLSVITFIINYMNIVNYNIMNTNIRVISVRPVGWTLSNLPDMISTWPTWTSMLIILPCVECCCRVRLISMSLYNLLKLELSFLGGRGGGGGICGRGGFWGEWHVWLRGKTSVNYYMICNKRVSMNLCYDVYITYQSERWHLFVFSCSPILPCLHP